MGGAVLTDLTDAEVTKLRKLLGQLDRDTWSGSTLLTSGLPLPPRRESLPTASKDTEGLLCFVGGVAGVADSWQICMKDAANAYAWVRLDNAAALADLSAIDFLVGTASGLLSSEIVVGTTPGGELGGTWASPTVDTTHSGSAHIVLPAGELGGSNASPTVNATHSGSSHASLALAVPEWWNPFNAQFATLGNAGTSGNQAVLWPMEPLQAGVTVTTLIGSIGVQSGNIDVGIYSYDGTTLTRVVSLGSTACPAASVRVVYNIADTALSRGTRYYAAIAFDNATATYGRLDISGSPIVQPNGGGFTKATSFPLPSTITTPTTFQGGPYLLGTLTGGAAL